MAKNKKKKKWKARTSKKPIPTIRVESSAVYVVPYQYVRSYFQFEIEDEGFLRSGCLPIVLSPQHEAGQATKEWVEMIFAAMDEVRGNHPREALEIQGVSPHGGGVDVGFLDIPVTFRGPLALVGSYLTNHPTEFLQENINHIDALLAGTFNDQMTLVTVLHMLRTDGTPQIHYHNLIFGVGREVRAGSTIIGPLDLEPMIDSLTKALHLGVITQPQ